jgi:hypothetical protein
MPDFWTIQGEAGKALDATVRDVSALGYTGLKIIFPSLGVDVFTFGKVLANLAPGSELLPENNQQVTLYRNAGKFFTGRALVSQDGYQVSVSVYGPGWEAEAIPMTGLLADQTGALVERAQITAGPAALGTMITGLVTRAAALGVPWQAGAAPTTWNSGRLTLQQMTCMGAITDVARMVPDLMQWIDYSTTPPTCRFSRRLAGLAAGSATALTLDARELDPDGLRVRPMLQQKIEQVRLPYTDRTAGGARRYQEQASGAAAVARVMWLPWSGPENDSFTLPEGGETAVIQTTPINVTLGTIKPTILSLIPAVQASRAGFANYPRPQDITLTNGEILTYWVSSSFGVTGSSNNATRTYQTAPLLYLDAATLQPVSPVGKHLVISADPPSWLAESAGFQKVKITGQLVYQNAVAMYQAPSYTSNLAAPVPPSWFDAFAFETVIENIGFQTYSGGPVNYDRALYDLWQHNFEIDAYLTSTAYTTGQTFRKPAEFEWSEPPAGFAAGLLAAQNWLPYEGQLAFTEAECGGTRYRGCIVHVSNALPELATMGAMVQSEELDIDNGRTILRLGAPERLSFSQVIEKFRRAPADNITVNG